MTLFELLIAVSLMAMLAVGIAAMADAVQQSVEYSDGYGMATQHARVAIERINRTIRGATASDEFPGVLIVSETVGSWDFPDTLVVWKPDAAAIEPDGMPRINELVVYCLDDAAKNELIELTDPGNTNEAPATTDSSAWSTAIASMKASNTAELVILTDLVRVSTVSDGDPDSLDESRGCLRFYHRLRPSATEWASYLAASTAWEDLSWPQSLYGSQTGVRQTWVRYELQLSPSSTVAVNPAEAMPELPFFGSAALYYELNR